MHLFQKIKRLIHIYYVILKHGVDKILWTDPQFHEFSRLIVFFPHRWLIEHEPPPPNAVREAFEELGPIFVKVGQLLSTRRDLLPDPLAEELANLQDNVPPFDSAMAMRIIEKNLCAPIDTIFDEFEATPLASASIAQVHSAKLKDGQEVVVKVLRPNIHQQVIQDVGLLETIAYYLERFAPHFRRFRPIDVIHEIKQTLLDELDLLREAASASQLKRNFQDSQSLYVPKIYWQYTTSEVMVIERVHATRIANVTELKAKGTNLKKLAERGVEIFFTQVFRDCFFHADMHPGNLFVKADDPENPQYIAVDFGIMGTLGPSDQRYLGENFLAFFKRDYRRVAELHVESGWVPPQTSVCAFESAIRTVCEPIFEKPLKDISFGKTLLRLFQTAKQFDMQIQPQLLLLQKTLLCVEGLGRQLYPELDLWQTAKPFLEKWMKRHYGPRRFLTNIKEKLPFWTEKLPELPEAIYDIVRFHQAHLHQMVYRETTKPPRKWYAFKPRQILGIALLIGMGMAPFFAPNQTQTFIQILGFLAGIYLIFAKQ